MRRRIDTFYKRAGGCFFSPNWSIALLIECRRTHSTNSRFYSVEYVAVVSGPHRVLQHSSLLSDSSLKTDPPSVVLLWLFTFLGRSFIKKTALEWKNKKGFVRVEISFLFWGVREIKYTIISSMEGNFCSWLLCTKVDEKGTNKRRSETLNVSCKAAIKQWWICRWFSQWILKSSIYLKYQYFSLWGKIPIIISLSKDN